MSIYTNVRVGIYHQYESLQILRKFLDNRVDIPSAFSTDISKPDFQHVEIGCIIPGHGLKGKKIWLHTDTDLQEMYETLQGKKSIQLWAYTHVTTNPQNKGSSAGSSSSTDSHKSSEVDQVYEQLREKHKENRTYSEEQFRMWAYLIKTFLAWPQETSH